MRVSGEVADIIEAVFLLAKSAHFAFVTPELVLYSKIIIIHHDLVVLWLLYRRYKHACISWQGIVLCYAF